MKDRTTKRLEEAYRLVLENNTNPPRFASMLAGPRTPETPEQLAAQNQKYKEIRNAKYPTPQDVINAYNASKISGEEAIEILMSQGIDQQKATEMIQTSQRGKREYYYNLSQVNR